MDRLKGVLDSIESVVIDIDGLINTPLEVDKYKLADIQELLLIAYNLLVDIVDDESEEVK